MFVNIQQWQRTADRVAGDKFTTTVMTGSDWKKLTEGELGIGGGGGGGVNSEYLSVILRGIQRKKADGREGEGVMEPIIFLTKRPEGVPMFFVTDSDAMLLKIRCLD